MESAGFLQDISSLTFLGYMLGMWSGGFLSNRFGLRPVIIMSAVMIPTTLLLSAYFNDYFIAYIIARFSVPFFTSYSPAG